MTLVPISALADEYGELERLLQVQLNAPQFKISECYDLTTPSLNANFEQYASTMQPRNVVTVFVPASDIGQPPADVAGKGFRVDPVNGFRVTLGSFNVDRTAETIEVFALQVALGATQNHQPPALAKLPDCEFLQENPTHADLKPGYHSLCVSGTNHYVVFSPLQVKCAYFVKFAGGVNLTESTHIDNTCDVCKEKEATVWCLNDAAKLCDKCDADSHAVNTVLSRHERLPIAEARSRMEMCPLHPTCRVEYYCPQCHIPVCINCKLTGTHSAGPAATHALVPIKDRYAQVLEETEREDPILIRRKGAIAVKLAASEKLLDEVLSNEESVENEIRKIAEEAVEQARKLAGEKALIVRSAETELERKLGELDALERSLLAHRKKSGPQAFLRAVDRQALLVSDLKDNTDLPLDLSVRGDLTVYGNLTVSGLRDSESIPGSQGRTASIVSGRENIDTSGFTETPSTPIRRRGESGLAITSLALVADKKLRRNRGVELTFQPFARSKIIVDPEERLMLYRCFPFKLQPQPHLLFSTAREGRSIAKMHSSIDGIGITVLFIQVGEIKFGGFAASKWNSDGVPFGDDGCSFLFNVTKDAVIPFKAGTHGAVQLFATENLISFGKEDLVIAGDFEECSSVIENSYGVGFPEGGPEAKTFLAGSEKFSADQLEVWGFYTNE